MKTVPTTWDETVYIDGTPGKYAVIARRHADKWYIAGVSNLDKRVELTLNLPMLSKGQTVDLYSEPDGNPLKQTKMTVKNPDKIKVKLSPNNGFIIVTQ